jgi:iron complex outermembrane receptor protein
MFYPRLTRTAMSLAVASACGLLAFPALVQQAASAAQDSAVPAAPTAAPAQPEPNVVMVTATRFSTSLLKTPIAVSAFSQEELLDKGVTNLIDLNNQIPNVQILEATASGQPNIVIRGISGTTTSTEIGEGAVGFHVDGVFQPRPQAAKALMFDLKQVEVLRGPQGTLFGRNSTAGSINVIPEKPDFSGNYGNASLELGTKSLRNVTVVQNIAINDRLAFRVAANHKTRDSFLNQIQDFTAGPTGKNSAGVDFNYPAGVPLADQRYNVKVDPSKYYGAVDQTAARCSRRAAR